MFPRDYPTTKVIDTDLLNKLTETVGFLNTVNLYQHNKDDNNHIYTVHTYYGIHIRVKVTNEPLFTDKQSGIITCYKKLTHTPNGTKGRDPKDFRLGNIEYNGNEVTGKLDYTKGNYKWDPLTSVSVYYYNHDTKYKDPLLVELEFNISKTKEIKLVKQYYKLKTCDGNNLEWEEDNNSLNSVIRDNVKLAKYLDDIRYRFKKVLKIEMDKQNSYPLMLSQNVGNADTFQKANDYKIEVEPCNNCTNLSNQDYKAFHHKISKINGGFDYNSIAGIVFTLPNTNGDIIKIPFFDSKTAKSVNNFHYDKCMGDIHVYFSKQSEPSAELPLFFNFNRKWYMPSKIENYFKGWSSYEGLEPDFEQKRLDIHKKIEDYIAKVKMIKQANKSETYTIELVKSFSEVDEIRSDNNNENSYDDLIKSYLNIDISDKYKERSDVGTETFTDNDLKSYIDVSKKPPANDLEIPNFHDLETSPLNDLEMPYSNEVQLPPIYNLKIPSDDDLEISPVNDSKISHARDLNIPYPHHLAVSPVDLKTSHVDIERPDKSMKNPFVNIDISPVNEFEITSVKDINKSVEIKMPCVDLETPFVDDSDIFSVDHFKMTHPNDLEIPYFNHLTVPSVDLKQSHVTIEKPFDDTKQHYIDIDMSPVNEFEITSVKDVNKSDIDTETPPDDDLEILPVKYPQTTYFSDPELESLDDKLRETLEKQSCIDKDQSKQVVNFKVLDFTQDDNKHVTLDKSLTEHSDDEKFSKPDFFPDPLASPLASTGLASTSADSDNSYLGPILGGTFGLLVTLGEFDSGT
nr:hypothetical protein MACL_00002297 [Theileria orientalis]